MATTGLYKLDDGETFASNCFPVRSRPGVEGAGHWLVTHKANQERKFKAMVCSKSLQRQECGENRLHASTPAQPVKGSVCPVREPEAGNKVLNAEFLLKSHYVDHPSDLCSVDISDKHLTSVKEDDFEQFDCVAYISATENLLSLGHFRKFSALRELELSMNRIQNLKVAAGDFPHLEILDLSYNKLLADDVLALGTLPRLRVLHLTGNGLTHLPSDLAVSELKNPEIKRFPSLEILMLDDNKLSHPSIFASLANLKRLKQLHLDKNGICEIPYLHQMEDEQHTSSPTWVRVNTSWDESSHSLQSIHSQLKNNQQTDLPGVQEDIQSDGEEIGYVVSSNKDDPDRTEVVFTSNPKPPEDISLLKRANLEKCFSFPDEFKPQVENSLKRLTPAFEPPLPELRYLSLSDNKIENEENLLAVALFPSLVELVIYDNPLTTLRSGDPPLLTKFLQDRLGIKLIRRKNLVQWKPHIFIPRKAKRKVKTRIPKIPKQPLMLGAPPEAFVWSIDFHSSSTEHSDSRKQSQSPQLYPDPLPPIKASSVAQSEGEEGMQHETTASSESAQQDWETDQEQEPENVDSVFMTQVDDLQDSSCDSQEDQSMQEIPELEDKGPHDPIPEIFRGYEELYYVEPDPDFIEPVGIRQNVRALEHALKHMRVYRESKLRLNSNQKPYHSKDYKVGKVPSIPLQKNKAEVLEDILSSMKEAKTYTEQPLESCLRNKQSNRKEYGEALMLLKEIQIHYNRFHEDAAKRAKNLEKMNRDIPIDRMGARDHLHR
ncbi:X-ray radiation resistance-associated protein 1 [Lissotriton helveticus]